MTATEAYDYYRISIDATGQRLGVERQQPPTLKMAERLGMTIVETFTDNDLSATSGVKRPDFERLLERLRVDPKPVLVWHLDRLLRLSDDLEKIIKTGVNVHAVEAGHFDLSTPAGRAVARTITAWATYEGEQKSLRQKLSLRQRATMGIPSWVRRPFGYEMDGTLRQPEARELAKAYRETLAGVSSSALARDWNERGILTTLGGKWTPVAVRDLLVAPRNAAISTYGSEEVGEGRWKPVVPIATFRAVQTLLTAPERHTGGGGPRRHLLTGVARCGVCDATVSAAFRQNRGSANKYKVYVCPNKHMSMKLEWVDRYVRRVCLNHLASPEGVALWESNPDGSKSAELMAEEVSLQARRDEFFNSMTEGDLTPKEYRTAVDKIDARLEEVRTLRRKVVMGAAAHGGMLLASEVVEGWDRLPMDRQRAFIEALASRVILNRRTVGQRGLKDGDIVVEFRES